MKNKQLIVNAALPVHIYDLALIEIFILSNLSPLPMAYNDVSDCPYFERYKSAYSTNKSPTLDTEAFCSSSDFAA